MNVGDILKLYDGKPILKSFLCTLGLHESDFVDVVCHTCYMYRSIFLFRCYKLNIFHIFSLPECLIYIEIQFDLHKWKV